MADIINKKTGIKLSGEDVLNAYKCIRDVCTRTEVRELDWVSKICGTKIVGKFENQQRTGSFKFRGAYYRIKYREAQKPIIAASAGNHGLAVAEAGKLLNVKTTICIPTTASPLKKERLSSYGHSIVQQGSSLEEAIAYAQGLAQKFDWDFISPYIRITATSMSAREGWGTNVPSSEWAQWHRLVITDRERETLRIIAHDYTSGAITNHYSLIIFGGAHDFVESTKEWNATNSFKFSLITVTPKSYQ